MKKSGVTNSPRHQDGEEFCRHNCGIVLAHTLADVYDMLKELQNRGREAAGIAAIGNNQIDVIKWAGNVKTFDIVDLRKIFPGHDYHTYIGHVRYATRGRKEEILRDAHPHVIGGHVIDNGNHVIIVDCLAAIVHNGQVNEKYFKDLDQSVMQTGCDSEMLLHFYQKHGAHGILEKIPGAYSLIIATKIKNSILAIRDRSGIKPAQLGIKDGRAIIASEDIAFGKNHAIFVEDLDPGTIYNIGSDGSYYKTPVVRPKLKYCFFEHCYVANGGSHLNNGILVNRVRELLGEACAAEYPFKDADFVTYLPRCPRVAAMRYAKVLGLPFLDTLYKMNGERAFQGSTSTERQESIKKNLYLLPEAYRQIKGKKVVVMDDSTIRGNNAKRLVSLFEEAGVKKIYYVNYTPHFGIIDDKGEQHCCYWGVDMPPDDDFIARNRTKPQIDAIIKADVNFLSIKGLMWAFKKVGLSPNHLCTFCIGGKKPF